MVSAADQYFTYEFLHQPSHEECISMSQTSPSLLFRRYTDLYYNQYESFLSDLFSGCKLQCSTSDRGFSLVSDVQLMDPFQSL